MVHGDDFAVLGWSHQLDWFWKKLKVRFLSKHRGRLGPQPSDLKSLRILNLIVEWTDGGIYYEGDQKHVEICLRELGLEESSREMLMPSDKSLEDPKNSNAPKAKEEEHQDLESSQSTRYRGLVARMKFLGQDHSEIQFAVKELAKDMSHPTKGSVGKLKRLLRYLKGHPRFRTLYSHQRRPDAITIWSASDFAGCHKSRKSTSAGIHMLGGDAVKSWSSNQAIVALSSGEAAYYVVVKAARVGIGIRRQIWEWSSEHR